MRLYFETQKIELVIFQFFFIEFVFFYRRNAVEKTTFFFSFFKYFVRCLKSISFFFSRIFVFDFIFFFRFYFRNDFRIRFRFFFRRRFFFVVVFFSFSFQFFVSQTKTKLNEFINIKKLIINIMKFSNKTRKKRKIEKKIKSIKNRDEKRAFNF